MSAAVSSLRPSAGGTTADDALRQKSRNAGVVSGPHLVAKALKNEGVETIFTLCGGHISDIYDSCVDEEIRIIDVRHESVAAHAADGYARQTGKLGCVVTTAGHGCTNAVTGNGVGLPVREPEIAYRPFSKFAEMLGDHGEEVREPAQIAGALHSAREAIHRTGRSAVLNIWVDPREYAPGTKNQTMHK